MRLGLFGCLLTLVTTCSLPAHAEQPSGPATLEDLTRDTGAEVASTGTNEISPTSRPAGTLVRPKDGVQHPDLNKAWAVYDEAIARDSGALRGVLAKQFDSATTKADLDAAEKWQGLLSQFDKHGTLPDEPETKSAVTAAKASFGKAREALQKVYESIRDANTRDKKIAEAKAVRDEWKELAGDAGGGVAQPNRGFPLIEGVWQEGDGIRVVVTQAANTFTANCEYDHKDHGQICWQMTGTISRDGQVKGNLVHTKAPRGWGRQVRLGRYSATDNAIIGRAQFEGGGHDFRWTRLDE